MSRDFVDSGFAIPAGFVADGFRLRMLTVNDVVKDFDAVASSSSRLKQMFPGWGGWPEGLTIEQNLIDLGWHQKEFQRRRSFAYTVVTLDESRVVGCVYLHPCHRDGYDAEVYLWARECSPGDAEDTALENAVKRWLESDWPFKRTAFPGRDIDWDSWNALATVE